MMPKIPPIEDRPRSGWTCREVLDAQAIDPTGTFRCGFCATSIRWIHVLEHDDYDREVQSGCCCAARLCFEYDAVAAEREAKNRMDRRARFMDLKRWKRSRPNPENVWRSVQTPNDGRVRVTVFLKAEGYAVCIARKTDGDRYFHPDKYASQSEAMSIAFELVECLKSGK
jgi:hypothetical protein